MVNYTKSDMEPQFVSDNHKLKFGYKSWKRIPNFHTVLRNEPSNEVVSMLKTVHVVASIDHAPSVL